MSKASSGEPLSYIPEIEATRNIFNSLKPFIIIPVADKKPDWRQSRSLSSIFNVQR